MSPQIKELLTEYLRTHNHQLLFPNKLGRPYNRKQIVAKVLHPVLDKLGIPHKGRRVGLHCFRHTLGSVLLRDNGVLIAQRQLRHKNPGITLKNYGHILDNDHVEAITDVESVLLPTNGTK
jgi:integrase